ncbi:MAG TPA: Lrp/AsnC family transcriptional regulator [Candidatus Nanoarchaeia archaeon]|nr:Lrp/AsnC family transcriptional regulator [Candidatus Nanoarchaeia archaeon]
MRFVQTVQAAKKVQLDLYDRKILFSLSQNCRTSATQIGKRVGLSRDAVRYRIARLEKSGVIQGYRTIVDINKFGYVIVHLLLQLNQPTSDAEKQLVEKFKGYSFCRAVIKFSGKYDFDLALVARDMVELDGVITKIIADCGNYLQHYELLFITKPFAGKTFPNNFVKMPVEKSDKKSEKYVPDDFDIKLLDIIADKADLPLYHIGQKLGLSADAAKYRIRKLLNAGIIIGFVPVINYDVIGYNVYAILLNISGLTPKRESTLAQFLSTNNDVLWAVKTIGKYNLLLYICTTDPDDLMKTTAALRSYFTESVRDFETLINYEEYKYTYWVNLSYLENK